MSLTSPSQAVERHLWGRLNAAHATLEKGHIITALQHYRAVLPNLISPQTGDLRWNRAYIDSTPSRNGLCRLLGGYYLLAMTWQTWRFLLYPLQERGDLTILPVAERAALSAIEGWASVRRTSLQTVIQKQQVMLNECGVGPALAFERAQLHLMLCHAFTLTLERKEPDPHGMLAMELFQECDSVFGVMRSYEIIGTAHYTAQRYEEALEYYAALERLIREIGDEAQPMLPYYGRGWVYLGLKDYHRALICFQSGWANKTRYDLHYDAARCIYAEGYVRLGLQDYQGAIDCQERAMQIFCDDDYYALNTYAFDQGSRSIPMMATCEHQLALAYEKCRRFRQAYTHSQRAVLLQSNLDDPGQMSDFLRRAAFLSLVSLRPHKTVGHLLEFLRLKLEHPRIPGFFY